MPPPNRDVTERWWRVVLIGGLALGIAVRVVDFLNCRSLGLDEARLAVNLASRSFLGLLTPLDLDQTAPPLFLWGERVMLLLFGFGDCVLRFLPFAAGTTAAVLIYPFARRFLDESEATLAGLIGIFCPLLITYSNALKQYSVELLAALILLLLLEHALRTAQGPRVALNVLAAGAVAPWISLSSVFVLVTAGLILVARAFHRQAGTARLAVAATVVWGVSGILAYTAVYRAASRNPYMQRFWELAFLQPGPSGSLPHGWKTIEDLVWAFLAGDPLVDRRPYLLWLHVGSGLVAVLCALGVIHIVRSRGWIAGWWLIGPAMATFGASVLGLFPIAPRLTLFLLPGLIVLFTAGLVSVLSVGRSMVEMRRLVMASVVLILPMALYAVIRAFSLEPTGNFQRLIGELQQRREAGQPVYVFARSLPAWIWYSIDWERPDAARLNTLIRAASAGGPAFENAPSRTRVQPDEADRLHSVAEAWGEVLGLPSGMEWREVEEHRRTEPDSGWSEIEERRIREAANPRIWVLASAFYAPETALFASLEHAAERRIFADTRPGSALVLYEFSKPETER